MRAQITPPVRRLLDALPRTGRQVTDPVRAAADATAAGCAVALEHTPAADAAAELRDLVARVAGAGLDVALDGAPAAVDALAAAPGPVTVVVRAADAGAEERCRVLAGGRVRLTGAHLPGRRGAAADLAFVCCLDVLLSGAGRPGVGTTDPRLVALAGERAAWNDRPPDSWEYVMPWQVRSQQQRRLVAGGYRVRVVLRSGPVTSALRPAGRS